MVASIKPPFDNPTTTVESHTHRHVAWVTRRLLMQGCVTGEAASLGIRSLEESLEEANDAAADDGVCREDDE